MVTEEAPNSLHSPWEFYIPGTTHEVRQGALPHCHMRCCAPCVPSTRLLTRGLTRTRLLRTHHPLLCLQSAVQGAPTLDAALTQRMLVAVEVRAA